MTSLADLLDDVTDDAADEVVFADGEGWTLERLQQWVDAIGAALGQAGVPAGGAVGVMLPDSAAIVAALFATWRAAGVYVPLNPRLSDTELHRVVDEVRPAAIITTADRAGRLDGRPVVTVGTTGEHREVAVGGAPAADPARYESDIALVQFTSGTTGRPRPVLLRHGGVLGLLDGVVATLRAKPRRADDDRRPMPNLIPVSLSLWAGIYQVLFAFRVGAPVVILGRFTTEGFVAAVKRFGIRSTVLPPAAMTMLSDDAGIGDLAPLKYVRSITAPLSPLQARRFRDRFGISVLNCYGQTEIGGEVVGWSGADVKAHGDDKLGSVGRPHAGVSVRVMGSDGAELSVDEPGELWVRTPALAAGYAGGETLADRLSPDGWFRTGDVGRVDAEGFVWIEGRVSDMINRGGLKVFPAEVAEVLRLAAAVADAAVVGVPDDRLGEVPWAFVVLTDGAFLDTDQLEALCRQHLAPYKVPIAFEAVDELPRNEIGKVLAGELVRRATARPGT